MTSANLFLFMNQVTFHSTLAHLKHPPSWGAMSVLFKKDPEGSPRPAQVSDSSHPLWTGVRRPQLRFFHL